MIYCRFSSDNWESDVYVYEAGSGFVVHVASKRIVSEIPPAPPIGEAVSKEYEAASRAHMAAVTASERVPINGPHDNKSFTFGTLQELFYCLTQLRADGYHVPQFVFDAIEEEMNEEPE